MEHILISPGKLKLMLTKSDLDHYALDCDSIDSEDAITRGAFRMLLDDVKDISGFDAADEKLFIQLYPSKDGGAEIYITKLTLRRDAAVRDERTCVTLLTVCAFEGMQELLAVCAQLARNMPPDGSSAWSGEDGYFLVLEDKIACRDYLHGKRPAESRKFIGEFGKIIGDNMAFSYVKERCLCFYEKNAVKMLADMV